MSIKVIINGAFGKMGATATKAILTETDLELVAETGRQDNLADVIKQHRADVIVDLTTPQAVFNNAKTIIESNSRPVIGTSGLTLDEIETLKLMCEKKSLGGIIAPNFSIGAILMMQFSKIAAQYFSDVEIIEMHHPNKTDAPSGTALKTAELISKHKISANSSKKIDENLKNNPARGKMDHDVPIHSMRLSGAFAKQSVLFANNDEILTIQHDALNRSAMMSGLFLCCRKVMKLNHLIYGIEELI
ncbi:MAG: dihydrodipicolinate reductase [uncultured bacterium]|nr:MAG: dihydrodipicolinate reductase [uncultured bacterium]